MLHADKETRRRIERHDAFVVSRPHRSEKARRYREERDVLDVGVMFWVIGHQVVHIVVLIEILSVAVAGKEVRRSGTHIAPPTNTQPSQEVRDEDTQ